MAQRNSPSRRIPGQPLAGILRTVAYQARYSNRRRSDVTTVTNSAAAAVSAQAAATGATMSVAPESMASAMAKAEAVQVYAASQPSEGVATFVAAEGVAVSQPLQDSAAFMVDGDGRATWQYEDRGTVPVVVATVDADQPAVATVSARTATAITVHVWDLSGQPVPGATVYVAARWP